MWKARVVYPETRLLWSLVPLSRHCWDVLPSVHDGGVEFETVEDPRLRVLS